MSFGSTAFSTHAFAAESQLGAAGIVEGVGQSSGSSAAGAYSLRVKEAVAMATGQSVVSGSNYAVAAATFTVLCGGECLGRMEFLALHKRLGVATATGGSSATAVALAAATENTVKAAIAASSGASAVVAQGIKICARSPNAGGMSSATALAQMVKGRNFSVAGVASGQAISALFGSDFSITGESTAQAVGARLRVGSFHSAGGSICIGRAPRAEQGDSEIVIRISNRQYYVLVREQHGFRLVA